MTTMMATRTSFRHLSLYRRDVIPSAAQQTEGVMQGPGGNGLSVFPGLIQLQA
jgi:hypothetical protein